MSTCRAAIAATMSLLLVGLLSTYSIAEPVAADRLSSDAIAGISAAIGEDQDQFHAVTWSTGFRLQNAPQRIATTFTRNGAEVHAGAYRWRLALDGIGYGDDLRPVGWSTPSAVANRVEYRHGTLVEWYVNGPAGLEQGFTLARAPGARNGRTLTLALALPDGTRATIDPDRRGATLRVLDVPALRYAGLTARDADNRALPAWLGIERDRLLLRIDDANARYPVIVDPVVSAAVLKPSDGELSFGDSMAISGDTIVVGAPSANSAQGAAYVFVKPAAGWSESISESAKLVASDAGQSDRFGTVAIDGDTVVVGASFASVDGNSFEGAAYVFVKPAGGWSGIVSESAKLTPQSGARDGDHFGTAVGIGGDTIVVGMAQDYCCNPDLAKSYVFVKPAAGWTGSLHENATLGNAQESDDSVFVGVAISKDGGTIVASFHGENGGSHFLNVFVEPMGGWSGALQPSATIAHSDGVISGQFAVTGDGGTVVVGTPFDGSSPDAAAAYVFVKPAGGWAGAVNESARLTASAEDPHVQYADAVAIDGDTIVLGEAPPNECAESGNCVLQRNVYVYARPSAGWSGSHEESQKITGPATDYYFGFNVAVDGSTILVADAHGGFGGPAIVNVLVKVAGDFTLGPIAPTTIGTDGSASAPVVVKSISDYVGDFSAPVALSVTGQPAGITALLDPSSVTPPIGGSVTPMLNVQAAPFVTPQTFSLTVEGVSGLLSHSTLAAITISATTGGITQVVGVEQAAGCIDNAGVANAVTSMLAQAQVDITRGDIHDAQAVLNDLLALLKAQAGKHIHTTCTMGATTFDPDAVLIADVQALLASL